MIQQHFKVFIRHFLKNKLYSVFSLISLVIALTACLLVIIYAHHEYSYDKFHKNYSDIYRVLMTDSLEANLYAQVCYPVTNYAGSISGVDNSVILYKSKLLIRDDDQFISEDEVFYTEPSFFNTFDFNLVQGSPGSLNNPRTVFLSQRLALKLFSKTNIVDRKLQIKYKSGETRTLFIKGVFENFPDNSHIQAEVLLPFRDVQDYFTKNSSFQWNNNSIYYYLQTSMDKKIIENRIYRSIPAEIKRSNNLDFRLQPLSHVHLFSNDVRFNIEKDSILKELFISLGLAFLIVFISISNYIIYILSVANSRMREIIIRRTIGASQKRLYKQVLWESLFQIFIALPLVALCIYWVYPYAEHYFDFQINLGNLWIISVLFFTGALLVGLLAGSIVSSYMVLPSLKRVRDIFVQSGKVKFNRGAIITVLQLSLFVAVIIVLMTIRKQIDYATNQNVVGFNYHNQISLRVNNRKLIAHWSSFKDQLLKYPEIQHVAGCMSGQPAFSTDMAGFKWKYDDNGRKYGYMKMGDLNAQDKAEFVEVFEKNNVSQDYFKALGIKSLRGRGFDASRNERKNIIVNEAFIKKHQIDDPVNKTISFLDSKYTIIGIVNNFKTKSLFKDKGPIVFFHTDRYLNQIIVRYNSDNEQLVMDRIQAVWNDFLPDTPMNYQFTNEVIRNYYHKEQQLADFINFFTLLAFVITLINLIGYSRLMFKNQERAIGIRRVFGARLKNIAGKLLKPYFLYSLISLLLGISIAFLFLNHWLANFRETAGINHVEYATILISVVAITVGVVFINVKMVMKKNPAQIIRDE
jgi:putative ABC transport system permease protein